MITRDQAHELAQAWLSAARPEPADISLYEFDLGWVAWRTPEPVAPGSPPASTGGPQIVVDRETGDISRWPSIAPSAIAEQYTAAHAEADRFPPDVHLILTKAGWFPGRDVSETIEAWLEQKAGPLGHFPLSDAARAALDEFGGLVLATTIDPAHRTLFYPAAEQVAISQTIGFAEEYEDEDGYAGPAFPIAFHENGPAEIVMDPRGRVFSLHWSDDLFLGNSIDEALITMCRTTSPPSAWGAFTSPDQDEASA
ncbi:SUKH-3 domain-containing protein [Symbioplanes lichenis]|uniref:SUKH-3 domain-containing protein n=1 Tax=Symbioplanes lichenis TaxID=1629072 RepID=UPI00273A430D|nr:SUKH-3 domain-containing protein [Actinoplanes lichenis]